MKTKPTTTGRKFSRAAAAAILLAGCAMAASAQQAPPAQPAPNSSSSLRLPKELVVYGAPLKPVVKASVLVNGAVITQTDVDRRVAMLLSDRDEKFTAQQMEQYRNQVLAGLIDEMLQIQAAKQESIEVKPEEIDRAISRFAENFKTDSNGLASMLSRAGSSITTLRRQVEAELAWRRLQSRRIESNVSVGDEEVKAVLAKLEASKGSEEYNVGEIFLSSNTSNRDQVYANAVKIIEGLQNGQPFDGIARQYSEASTAAVGGDLGWFVRTCCPILSLRRCRI